MSESGKRRALNDKKKKTLKYLKTAAGVVLALILFVSSLFSVILTMLKFTVFNIEYYEKIILTDEYYAALKIQIDEDIDQVGVSRSFTELSDHDKEALKSTISYDVDASNSIKRFSRDFLLSIVDHMTTGSKINPIEYRNDAFYEQIKRIKDAEFGEDDPTDSIAASDEDIAVIYDDLCAKISTDIMMIEMKYWDQLPDFSKVSEAANIYYLPIILTAASAAVIFTMYMKKRTTAYYHIAFPMWFASLVLFVPTIMLNIYNIPSRIKSSVIAGISPLVNVVIGNFITNIVQLAITVTLILFAVLTILLLLSILANANHHGNHYVKSRSHHHSSEHQSGGNDDPAEGTIDLV